MGAETKTLKVSSSGKSRVMKAKSGLAPRAAGVGCDGEAEVTATGAKGRFQPNWEARVHAGTVDEDRRPASQQQQEEAGERRASSHQ